MRRTTRGNVWYFGEDTAELDKNGHVAKSRGDVAGGRERRATPVFMPAQPQGGQSFQQEFAKGQAEDHSRSWLPGAARRTLRTIARVDDGSSPGRLDSKIYVRGIGTVLELTLKGGNERFELVSMTKG